MNLSKVRIRNLILSSLGLVGIFVGGIAIPVVTLSESLFSVSLREWHTVASPQKLQSNAQITPWLVQSANELSRPSLVVYLSDRRVNLYRYNQVEKSYPVAIGKPGWETPVGTFAVDHLDSNPAWKQPITGEVIPPGENNPLGKRWIGFWGDGVYQIGFHGSYQEELIGQAVSHGCLRMRNADVLELYEEVDLGTMVTVKP